MFPLLDNTYRNLNSKYGLSINKYDNNIFSFFSDSKNNYSKDGLVELINLKHEYQLFFKSVIMNVSQLKSLETKSFCFLKSIFKIFINLNLYNQDSIIEECQNQNINYHNLKYDLNVLPDTSYTDSQIVFFNSLTSQNLDKEILYFETGETEAIYPVINQKANTKTNNEDFSFNLFSELLNNFQAFIKSLSSSKDYQADFDINKEKLNLNQFSLCFLYKT